MEITKTAYSYKFNYNFYIYFKIKKYFAEINNKSFIDI